MSDDKKPKKDLRARLGRTISPNTPGAPPIATSLGGMGGDAATAEPIPSPVVAPPVAAPSVGGLPFGGPNIAPPPFAQPSAPPPAKGPVDPFAAVPAAAGPQEIRLVFDDKLVQDAEVGRKQRGRNFILVLLGLALGAGLGFGFGSMNSRRQLFNATVRDGDAIYATVNDASSQVLSAQQKIDRLIERAAGQGGQQAGVDYDAIRELQALPLPISAGAFANKNYGAFNPATVNDLFAYYNNVQLIWERIGRLAATTLSDARRAELDRTAQAAADSATAMYGVVPVVTEEGVRGSLVFLEPGSTENKVTARPRRGGQGRELDVFVSGTTLSGSPSHVMLVDGAQSAGVLSEQLGAFRSYVNEIRELKTLMDQTIEIQGRLTTALGEIAALEEGFAL